MAGAGGVTAPMTAKVVNIDKTKEQLINKSVKMRQRVTKLKVSETEHKLAKKILQAYGENIRLIFESVTDGITISDLDGKVVDVNQAKVRLHGCDSKSELIGRSAFEFITEQYRDRAIKGLKKTLNGGNSGNPEYTFLTKDRREFTAESSTAVLRDTSGIPLGFIIITKDITEHRRMKEQLIVTDRLASVGELASGIAHELNNPLTSVIGFSELLLEKSIPSGIKADIDAIHRQARRATEVIRNLLTFVQQHAPTRQPMNINKAIRKVLKLRAYEQKVTNIRVNTQLARDLPEIMADSFQLEQVFLNIVINTEYFMAEAHNGGTLTIVTEKAGDIVMASFADDGPGITKENLGRLFDSFFTTKEVGKGTGLGLSISREIIDAHGGRIYVESTLGKGATFIVELPVIASTRK